MIKPEAINGKNLKTRKGQLIQLAKKIVHARDNHCRICGCTHKKMDAAHIIPVSRGFLYATDTCNIIKACCTCHRLGSPSMHSDETWMWEKLQIKCPEVYVYCQRLLVDYADRTQRINVGVVKDIAHALVAQARSYGIE